MKKKLIIITSLLAATVGVAFAVSKTASSIKEVAPVEAASSATHAFPTSDGSFYYRAYWGDDKWTSAVAKMWGYFWDNNGHTCWTSTCINTDDNLIYYDSSTNSSYYVVVPSSTSYTWTGAQLVRFDSGSTTSRGSEWNRTPNITFGSTFNCVGPNGNYGSTYTTEIYNVSYFEAGCTYYMDLSQGHYDWTAANHNIYAHLFSGNVTTASIDVQLTRVLGFSNDELWQFVVPNTSDYFRLILHRGTTSSGYTNQTDKLYKSSNNVFKLNSYTTGTWDWNLSDGDRANYYGTYFLSQITCSGAGSITSSSSNWTNVKNEYNRLSKTIQGLIWTSSGAETGTDLVKAMYRYDYIVFKKAYSGYNDFINRATSPGKSFTAPVRISVLNGGDQTTPIKIIVIVSLISLTAIGGYFYLKKRKEQ